MNIKFSLPFQSSSAEEKRCYFETDQQKGWFSVIEGETECCFSIHAVSFKRV
jgi:hypothetical protein